MDKVVLYLGAAGCYIEAGGFGRWEDVCSYVPRFWR